MTKDWISEIADEMQIDDLPEDYQEIARLLGMELALKLARHLNGGNLYCRKIERLLCKKRDEKIRAEFTGFNHRELARCYGLTETWIREIVKRKPVHEQAEMFSGST